MNRFIAVGAAALVALMGSAPKSAAQTEQRAAGASVDARWLPWIGCWRPASQRSPEEGVHICVVPAGASGGARIMTLAGDQSVIEETVIPDGMDRAVEEPNCRGSRRSEWSADGQRVFSSAEISCDKEAARKVSGLSLLSADAEWIDIQVVDTENQESVRVRRYQRSSDAPRDPALIPAELAARASKSALGARLTVDHIREASSKVSSRVIEALLFETKATFPLDSRQLIALDDAGVADTVIDLMVAFSFPKKFAVKRSVGSSGGFGSGGLGWGGLGWGSFLDVDQAWPWYYSPYSSYSYYSPFGYSSWNYWGSGDYYGPLASVFTGGGAQSDAHGRVVNGGGYTQVVPRAPENNGQTAERGRSSGDGASTGGWASGGGGVSSGGYSSGGGSGGGGDSGRTAVPR